MQNLDVTAHILKIQALKKAGLNNQETKQELEKEGLIRQPDQGNPTRFPLFTLRRLVGSVTAIILIIILLWLLRYTTYGQKMLAHFQPSRTEPYVSQQIQHSVPQQTERFVPQAISQEPHKETWQVDTDPDPNLLHPSDLSYDIALGSRSSPIPFFFDVSYLRNSSFCDFLMYVLCACG